MKVINVWLGLASLSILSAQDLSKAPQAAAPNTWGSKTIQVKYVDPEQLRRMFSGQSYVMEADRDLKVLTAHGPPAFLKEVEDTVKQFDIAPPPPANIQITVYLLAVAEQAPSSEALPSELAVLAKELKTAGSPQELKLADSQMIRVRAGWPAEAMGSVTSLPTAASLSRLQLGSASLRPDAKGNTISLDGLRVWLNVPSGPETPRSESKSNGDVVADIDVADNKPAVVTKTGMDKPLVVIVRASVVH